jgi:FixJ family two-component response regulator
MNYRHKPRLMALDPVPTAFLGGERPNHAGEILARVDQLDRMARSIKFAGGVLRKARKVSIVEDDRFFRESMIRLLRSLGYSVQGFPSAAAFLDSPSLAKTIVLITDICMPAMNGLDLYRTLISSGRPIPTILMTSYPDDAVEARALSDGVVCYLRKPVDEQHLARCLRLAIESGETTEENS